MTRAHSIVRAHAEHAGQIADLIGAAFHGLDVARWLVPDPQERTRVLPANFRILIDHALAHGEIHQTVDGHAAAVWFPHESPLPEPACYQQRVQRACGQAAGRFLHLDDLFEAHHPTGRHHHLAFLAVHPDRQGQGRGTTLLQRYHLRLDARLIPAYLEATSTGSRDLYLRHGYQHQATFRLPDGTPIYSMWRPAGGGLEGMVVHL